ncbi:MAG: hypothetical protein Q4G40_12750 [Brachybacterium sp.]|nr:hypothetical protein [Brachybacterium sp.]
MTYDACRAAYASMIADGATLRCACGCGTLIDASFHLGHDEQRTRIVGPMTSGCNLRMAGRARRR